MLSHRLHQAAELLYLLVLKELKVRYKSSVLGYLWALANPFAFAFVYWFAFKFIMRVDVENYSLFLITGLFPWIWLSASVTQATRSFHNNVSLVKKVRIDRPVLPLSNALQEMMHFLFALPVLLGFLVFAGELYYLSWLWLIPLMLLTQLAFVYPLAAVLALTNVYLRDVEYLVGIGFSLLFFAIPMVYPLSMVPAEYRVYIEINPLNALIQSWRTVLLEGSLNGPYMLYVLVCASLFGVIAWWAYRRYEARIVELL
jgi:lipopolysaccharide transport system permease protein